MAMKPIEILINAKDEASGVFDRLNNKLKVVGAAVAGYFGIKAFAGIVEGAAEFEGALSRVKAATGASAEEMERLKKAAEDAGANTKYTSVEAAAALENLAKAGLSAGDAIETLPAVLALAQAGDIELATSAEYVTKAVMGMGLAFSDAGRVADVLALGANATNTSVEGLAQALSYAAPTANSLGVSLESTVAIIGKFADAGIDASRAGTALNSIMSQFSDPASKFRRELADAGITTNNFEDALHQLADAGPRGAKAINAVGLEAGPALKALLNQGMPALDELKAKLDAAAGSAAATAKTMEDNLKGSMTGLASAWDTVKNVLGTPVLPVIKDGVDQLAGAFRSAVADGTIQKFGEAIATAFQAGIKWVKEFIGQVDFAKVTESMRAFADRAGAAFTQLGEYATNAGNIVKTAYGVMSAGTNAVLAAIYGIGSVFTEMASVVMSGVAKLRDGLATVTFGKLSESFRLAADDARNMAQGFGEAAQAMRDKASSALGDVADSAQLARDGFAGLTTSAAALAPAVKTTEDAVAALSEAMRKEAEAAYLAIEAEEKKQEASVQAKQATDDNRAAIALLREEYAALVASGHLQAAAEKLKEIDKALQGTTAASQDAAKAAEDAAAQIDAAFARLGVTSSAALKEQAANAQRDYDTIKNAGTSTAQDIAAAFKVAAEKAIAANNGIAPSWVTAQAGVRGYKVEVDAAGSATLKTGRAINDVTKDAQGGWKGVANSTREATRAAEEYQQRIKEKYGRPGEGDKGLFERGRTSTRGEELGEGVEEIGTGGHQFRNKDGFTSDAKGNVQQQWVWTRAAIIDYLKQAGLDEKLSEDLAKQFVQSDGTVPYMAGAAQKRWGGQHSTLSEALGKMVDYYKYDDSGKHEAQERSKFLSGKSDADTKPADRAPDPSAVPASAGRSSGITAGPTYVSNITIPGLGNASLNFSDAHSQRQAEGLLRQLAQAKSTAIR